MNILFVGDIHIRLDNFEEIDKLQIILKDILSTDKYDYIIFGGDILHSHEKLHTLALNKATDFLESFISDTKVICLVGNHDMINNQQFLTQNHWMNSLKKSIIVIDTPKKFNDGEIKFSCIPYVYNGRFVEALSYIDNYKENDIIFCHQEFKGCKMGAIISENGDEWSEDDVNIISGHIHDYQKPQKNIFYPGTPIQHSFGDKNKNIILKITKNDTINYQEISVNIEKKKNVHVDVDKLKDIKVKTDNPHNTKITITGTIEELKAIKNTAKFKELIADGFKISTKSKTAKTLEESSENVNYIDENVKSLDFQKILLDILQKETNKFVLEDYKNIFN
jgi:predicted phosphodiesterase